MLSYALSDNRVLWMLFGLLGRPRTWLQLLALFLIYIYVSGPVSMGRGKGLWETEIAVIAAITVSMSREDDVTEVLLPSIESHWDRKSCIDDAVQGSSMCRACFIKTHLYRANILFLNLNLFFFSFEKKKKKDKSWKYFFQIRGSQTFPCQGPPELHVFGRRPPSWKRFIPGIPRNRDFSYKSFLWKIYSLFKDLNKCYKCQRK